MVRFELMSHLTGLSSHNTPVLNLFLDVLIYFVAALISKAARTTRGSREQGDVESVRLMFPVAQICKCLHILLSSLNHLGTYE